MDTAVRFSPERFAEGLTMQQYIRGMSKNQELFIENYNNFTLEPEDEAFLRGLDRKLKVVVLAEDWCGDVLRYLPAFARMLEVVPQWEARVFYRDSNLDLADLWLKEGKYRAIPVMVFFDEEMNEIACYVEKPAAVYEAETLARGAFEQLYPQLADARFPTTEMSEETLALYATFIREYRARMRGQWQRLFVNEIRRKLEAGAKS